MPDRAEGIAIAPPADSRIKRELKKSYGSVSDFIEYAMTLAEQARFKGVGWLVYDRMRYRVQFFIADHDKDISFDRFEPLFAYHLGPESSRLDNSVIDLVKGDQ